MQVTVGLSPGSRHIGIAVMHKKRLITWRVQTFKGRWSKWKESFIIEALQNLFASYEVEAVSVKLPDIFPDSLAFSQVLGIVNNLCEQQGTKAVYFKLSQIKQRFSDNPKVTKEAITSYLAHQHPELRLCYQKEQRKRSRYYVRVFEAVAAALCTGEILNLPK